MRLTLVLGVILLAAAGLLVAGGGLQYAPTPDSVVVGSLTVPSPADGTFPLSANFVVSKTANLTGVSVQVRGVGLEGRTYGATLYWRILCGARYVNAGTSTILLEGQGATDYSYGWYTLSLLKTGNQVVQGETCNVRFELQLADSGLAVKTPRNAGYEFSYRVWGILPSSPASTDPEPGDPTNVPTGPAHGPTTEPGGPPQEEADWIPLAVLGLVLILAIVGLVLIADAVSELLG